MRLIIWLLVRYFLVELDEALKEKGFHIHKNPVKKGAKNESNEQIGHA